MAKGSAFGTMFGGSMGCLFAVIAIPLVMFGGCILMMGSCAVIPAVNSAREAARRNSEQKQVEQELKNDPTKYGPNSVSVYDATEATPQQLAHISNYLKSGKAERGLSLQFPGLDTAAPSNSGKPVWLVAAESNGQISVWVLGEVSTGGGTIFPVCYDAIGATDPAIGIKAAKDIRQGAAFNIRPNDPAVTALKQVTKERFAAEPTPEPEDEYREWTSTSGTTVKARFISFSNGVAQLQRDDTGKIIKVSYDKLSPDDQLWIGQRGQR